VIEGAQMECVSNACTATQVSTFLRFQNKNKINAKDRFSISQEKPPHKAFTMSRNQPPQLMTSAGSGRRSILHPQHTSKKMRHKTLFPLSHPKSPLQPEAAFQFHHQRRLAKSSFGFPASPCSGGGMMETGLSDLIQRFHHSSMENELKPSKSSWWSHPVSPVSSSCDLAGFWASGSDLAGLSEMSDDGGSSCGSPVHQCSVYPSTITTDSPANADSASLIAHPSVLREKPLLAQVSCDATAGETEVVGANELELAPRESCEPQSSIEPPEIVDAFPQDQSIQPSGRPPSPLSPPSSEHPGPLSNMKRSEPHVPTTRHDPYGAIVFNPPPPLPPYHLSLAPPTPSENTTGLHAAAINAVCLRKQRLQTPCFIPFPCDRSDSPQIVNSGDDCGYVVNMVVRQYACNEWLRHEDAAVLPIECINRCIAAAFERVPEDERPVAIDYFCRWQPNSCGTWFPSGVVFLTVWFPLATFCDFEHHASAFVQLMSHCFLMDRYGVWFDPTRQTLGAVSHYYKRSMGQDDRHRLTEGLPTGPLVFEISRSSR
jgi:hypothetical protein